MPLSDQQSESCLSFERQARGKPFTAFQLVSVIGQRWNSTGCFFFSFYNCFKVSKITADTISQTASGITCYAALTSFM